MKIDGCLSRKEEEIRYEKELMTAMIDQSQMNWTKQCFELELKNHLNVEIKETHLLIRFLSSVRNN